MNGVISVSFSFWRLHKYTKSIMCVFSSHFSFIFLSAWCMCWAAWSFYDTSKKNSKNLFWIIINYSSYLLSFALLICFSDEMNYFIIHNWGHYGIHVSKYWTFHKRWLIASSCNGFGVSRFVKRQTFLRNDNEDQGTNRKNQID